MGIATSKADGCFYSIPQMDEKIETMIGNGFIRGVAPKNKTTKVNLPLTSDNFGFAFSGSNQIMITYADAISSQQANFGTATLTKSANSNEISIATDSTHPTNYLFYVG